MSFTIPVNSLARKGSRTSWVGFALIAVVLFVNGMRRHYHDWLQLATAFFGAALLAGVVLYLIFGKAYQLVVDENGVRGQINHRRRIDLNWTDITKVAFLGQRLKLQFNDGTTQNINLAYFTYAEYREMKKKLQSILADHGIAIYENAASKRRFHV